jgi:hypothetical protein
LQELPLCSSFLFAWRIAQNGNIQKAALRAEQNVFEEEPDAFDLF